MREFISKLTFGFFMAQLFPGAVFVFSITCPFKVVGDESLYESFKTIRDFWFGSTSNIITFFVLSIAIGMLIHGLHWAIVAWIENKLEEDDEEKTVRDSFWHQYKIWKQVLISPLKMVIEILWLLTAPNIDKLTMQENVPKIEAEHMPMFVFLQEFYLYFAQFYAHTAYALLFSILCILWVIYKTGITEERVLFLIFLYFLTSGFFLLGRAQLGSLFKAERYLKNARAKREGETKLRSDVRG